MNTNLNSAAAQTESVTIRKLVDEVCYQASLNRVDAQRFEPGDSLSVCKAQLDRQAAEVEGMKLLVLRQVNYADTPDTLRMFKSVNDMHHAIHEARKRLSIDPANA